jgi:hypothetical protein
MNIIRNESGFALVFAMLALMVLTTLGVYIMNTSSFEMLIAGNDKWQKRTFYQAEASAIMSAEVLEQNINCDIGFTPTTTGGSDDTATPDLVESDKYTDINGNIRVWSRTSNERRDMAFYLDPRPWTDTPCNITDPVGPNISYPIGAISSGEFSDVFVGGESKTLAGGSLIMAAGYERKGKSAAGGGVVREYDIISRQQGGAANSEATVILGWRHLVDEQGDCEY